MIALPTMSVSTLVVSSITFPVEVTTLTVTSPYLTTGLGVTSFSTTYTTCVVPVVTFDDSNPFEVTVLSPLVILTKWYPAGTVTSVDVPNVVLTGTSVITGWVFVRTFPVVVIISTVTEPVLTTGVGGTGLGVTSLLTI